PTTLSSDLSCHGEGTVDGCADRAMAPHTEHVFLVGLGTQVAVIVLNEPLDEPAQAVVEPFIAPLNEVRQLTQALLLAFVGITTGQNITFESADFAHVAQFLHALWHDDAALRVQTQITHGMHEL